MPLPESKRECLSKTKPPAETRRLTVYQIFRAAVENAREEIKRSPRTLAFPGLAGDSTMGLTGLGVASVRALIGDGPWQQFISYFIYPVGFIAVIIGRAQLFTENTLYPVILGLDERRHFTRIFRLWVIVFTSNVVGAFLFPVLAIKSAALRPEIADQLVKLGLDSVHGTGAYFFWSGVIGGWLIALVAWVVSASHWTIGQVVMVWLLAFVVGVGKYAHCIATSGEILSAVLAGRLGAAEYLYWLLLATLGNIVGGVVVVSLLNYGQVREA